MSDSFWSWKPLRRLFPPPPPLSLKPLNGNFVRRWTQVTQRRRDISSKSAEATVWRVRRDGSPLETCLFFCFGFIRIRVNNLKDLRLRARTTLAVPGFIFHGMREGVGGNHFFPFLLAQWPTSGFSLTFSVYMFNISKNRRTVVQSLFILPH